jgi:hypothetical protein
LWDFSLAPQMQVPFRRVPNESWKSVHFHPRIWYAISFRPCFISSYRSACITAVSASLPCISIPQLAIMWTSNLAFAKIHVLSQLLNAPLKNGRVVLGRQIRRVRSPDFHESDQ